MSFSSCELFADTLLELEEALRESKSTFDFGEGIGERGSGDGTGDSGRLAPGMLNKLEELLRLV